MIKKTGFLTFIILFSFLYCSFSYGIGVKSLAGLPYHPDEKEGALNLYNLGNTAFAIQSYPKTFLNLRLTYTHIDSDFKPEFVSRSLMHKKNGFSFSDATNPHQGFFYRLPLDLNLPEILIFAAAGGELDLFKNIQNPDAAKGKSFLKEGKAGFSAHYQGFYVGGFFLLRHYTTTKLEVKEHEHNTTPDYYFPLKPTQNYALPYYQFALGYQITPRIQIGLSFDNIFYLGNTRQKEILEAQQIKNNALVPYLALDQFKNPLYKFDGSKPNFFSGGYNTYYWYEETGKNQTYHFDVPLLVHFDAFDFAFTTQIFYVSYQTNITFFNTTPDSSNYYTKKGDYSLVNFVFLFALKPYITPEKNKWFFNCELQTTHFSSLSEKITGLDQTATNSLNQKIFFNQEKISFTLGYQTPIYEWWAFLTYQKNQAFTKKYRSTFDDSSSVGLPGLYPLDTDGTLIKGQSPQWSAFYGGMALRAKIPNWVFDCGASFITTYTPAKAFLTTLNPIASVFYHINTKTQLGLECELPITLRYEYKGGKETVQEGGNAISYNEHVKNRMFAYQLSIIYRQTF